MADANHPYGFALVMSWHNLKEDMPWMKGFVPESSDIVFSTGLCQNRGHMIHSSSRCLISWEEGTWSEGSLVTDSKIYNREIFCSTHCKPVI